jgi:hypothetical protein
MLKEKIKVAVNAVLTEVYKGKQEFSVDYLGKHAKPLPGRLRLGAKVSLRPKAENLSTVELITRYYCFSRDAEKIQEGVLLELLAFVKADQTIKMG